MAYNPAGMSTPGVQGAIPAPVSSTYCVPYVAQFVVDQKLLTVSSGKFTISDAQGKLLFDVKGKFPPLPHTKRLLRDASGHTILLMKKKIATMHDRWTVTRGDGESEELFTMAKTSVYQFQPSFEVFLTGNNSSKPDFLVKGDIFQYNYSVFYGNTPIAETRKKLNMASVFMGKDKYGVTVYPGVDHAFIAAVIVIVDQVKQDDEKAKKEGGGSGLLTSGFAY